ncbi:MAG: RHS repeat-associated core domain-containing protein, partial [Candidatus Obscuribacter phosphatis]|nr:RHS repeat-associated core domain-containing protein [Candidatus Obscuribacter phosphatis]
AATLPDSQKFAANATLSSGANTIPASVTDGTNTTKNSSYRVSAKGSASSSPTFDANGNMTTDGTNTYEWDAENRLVKITYPGSSNNSQITYDGSGLRSKIVEVSNGTTTSTRQFVWTENEIKELRDGTGAVLSKYFGYGQTSSGNNYFCTRDQLTSVCELLASGGSVQSQYSYSPYGRVANLQAGVSSDFQYAGYYAHAPSGLNLAVRRAYAATSGRWISRDPEEESEGINLYRYVNNSPVNYRDPSGRFAVLLGLAPYAPYLAAAAYAAAALLAHEVGGQLGTAVGRSIKDNFSASENLLEDEYNRKMNEAKAKAVAEGLEFDPCKWIDCLINSTQDGKTKNKYRSWGKALGCINKQKRESHY